MSRKLTLTEWQEREDRFFAAIQETGLLYKSLAVAGYDHARHYLRLAGDPAYKARYDQAQHVYNELIEAEIHRRAVKGVEKAVFYQGCRCDEGKVIEYSDSLLEFQAKSRMAKYREKVADITMTGGVVVINSGPTTVEDWEKKFAAEGGEAPPVA